MSNIELTTRKLIFLVFIFFEIFVFAFKSEHFFWPVITFSMYSHNDWKTTKLYLVDFYDFHDQLIVERESVEKILYPFNTEYVFTSIIKMNSLLNVCQMFTKKLEDNNLSKIIIKERQMSSGSKLFLIVEKDSCVTP